MRFPDEEPDNYGRNFLIVLGIYFLGVTASWGYWYQVSRTSVAAAADASLMAMLWPLTLLCRWSYLFFEWVFS